MSSASVEKIRMEGERNEAQRAKNSAELLRLRAHREKLALKSERVSARKRRNTALVKRLEESVHRIEKLSKPAPRPAPKMPPDFDPVMTELWPLVQDRTMTGPQKTNTLVETVRYIERHRIPGAVVECGVWRGGSMLAIVHMLLRLGVVDRELYLFDTYAGMTEPTERDVHIQNGMTADHLLESKFGAAKIWEIASVEDVRSGLDDVGYPAEKLHYVVGRVEDTIPEQAPEQIALLRLDTDWYESTKHELEQLYSRLAPGGILIIDDYGSWQGSKDATDEFLETTGEPLMLIRVDRGRVAIKPGLTSRVPEPAWASAAGRADS